MGCILKKIIDFEKNYLVILRFCNKLIYYLSFQVFLSFKIKITNLTTCTFS